MNSIQECSKCKQYYYCSTQCLKSDSVYHEPECSIDLVDIIKQKFSEVFSSNLSQEAIFNGFDSINEYFTTQDIIDYSMVFFRVLRRARNIHLEEVKDRNESPKLSVFNSSIGDLKQRIYWRSIPVNVNVCCKSKSDYSDTDVLSNYINHFDSLTDNEAVDFDKLLGFELPDDKYFENVLLKNTVKYVLSKMIDKVSNEITDEYIDWNHGLMHDQFSATNTYTESDFFESVFDECDDHELSEEELYFLFDNDLKEKKIWDHLSKFSYERASEYIQNMFQLFKKSYLESRDTKLKDNSQKRFNSNLDHQLDKQTVFCEKLPDDCNYVSHQLKFDTNLINECDNISMLKMNYRLNKLETILNSQSNSGNELEYYFGFWIKRIMQILNQQEVILKMGTFSHEEIEKAFYIVSTLVFFEKKTIKSIVLVLINLWGS